MQLLTPPHFYADSALPFRRKLGHLFGYNFRFRIAIGSPYGDRLRSARSEKRKFYLENLTALLPGRGLSVYFVYGNMIVTVHVKLCSARTGAIFDYL